MKPYRNLSGDAGVAAYELGPDWIRIQFIRGGTYRYTRDSVGSRKLKEMKRLAEEGRGLTTFINQHPGVKNGYTTHLE